MMPPANMYDTKRPDPRSGSRPASTQQAPLPTVPYQGNSFLIKLYKGWIDKTVHTITGPVTDGIQHNIVVTVDTEVQTDSLVDYADWQVTALEEQLKGCLLLKKEKIALANGLPAYRAIFRWYPTDELRLYQEQIYVLAGTVGYRITASFTKKTRKTLGPGVERMMLSFTPKASQ